MFTVKYCKGASFTCTVRLVAQQTPHCQINAWQHIPSELTAVYPPKHTNSLYFFSHQMECERFSLLIMECRDASQIQTNVQILFRPPNRRSQVMVRSRKMMEAYFHHGIKIKKGNYELLFFSKSWIYVPQLKFVVPHSVINKLRDINPELQDINDQFWENKMTKKIVLFLKIWVYILQIVLFFQSHISQFWFFILQF